MAISTNYLTPTSFFEPPHGKGPLQYKIRVFHDYADAALLELDVNAFFDSLSVDGLPWPHIVSITQQTVLKGVQTMITLVITYLLVSP